MTKAKWVDRLKGELTEADVRDAEDWMCCAVGEIIPELAESMDEPGTFTEAGLRVRQIGAGFPDLVRACAQYDQENKVAPTAAGVEAACRMRTFIDDALNEIQALRDKHGADVKAYLK